MNSPKTLNLFFLLILLLNFNYVKNPDKNFDSIYTEEIDKVLHAGRLYINSIRDLGARKAEKESNIGFGIIDRDENLNECFFLIEYK